jgi:hypothetical protein
VGINRKLYAPHRILNDVPASHLCPSVMALATRAQQLMTVPCTIGCPRPRCCSTRVGRQSVSFQGAAGNLRSPGHNRASTLTLASDSPNASKAWSVDRALSAIVPALAYATLIFYVGMPPTSLASGCSENAHNYGTSAERNPQHGATRYLLCLCCCVLIFSLHASVMTGVHARLHLFQLLLLPLRV